MSENKRQTAIYKINTNLPLFNNTTDYIATLLKQIKSNNRYQYTDLTIAPSKFQNYETYALQIQSIQGNKWENFLNQLLSTSLNFTPEKIYSVILLLKNKNSSNIYAITFGLLGYFSIKDYIVDSFGIDILSHIVTPESIYCKTTKAQSLVGQKQGETSVYRNFHTLEEMIDDFGKIFQELIVSLDDNILTHFGIEPQGKKLKHCLAKDSFRINAAIQANDIEKILDGCEWALTQPKHSINAVKILDRKQDKTTINKLNTKVAESLLKTFNQEHSSWNFDLCHKEYEKYLTATHTNIQGKFSAEKETTFIEIQELFACLKQNNPGLSFNQRELEDFIKNTKLITFDEEEKTLTSGSIYNHLFDDEEVDDKKFFLLNGSWYQLEDSFLTDLNNRLKYLLQSYYLSNNNFLLPWNSVENETDYIKVHTQQSNTIIIHPNTVEHIELCDIMHWDNDTLYLYFIKQGFGNDIRSLSSQVLLSATKVFREIKSEFSYLKKVHKKLKDMNLTSLAEQDFLELFKKNIIVVFAFRDSNKNERNLKANPKDFNSNIAKYSTLKLITEMRNLDPITLKIYQIPK